MRGSTLTTFGVQLEGCVRLIQPQVHVPQQEITQHLPPSVSTPSSPGEGVDHPLLINKMFLGSAAIGLALGVLLTRRRLGEHVCNYDWGRRWQSLGGLSAVGLVLLTASIGGTFTRGESLLDLFKLPYDTVPLMPVWLSGIVLLVAIGNLLAMRRGRTV